VHLMDQVK